VSTAKTKITSSIKFVLVVVISILLTIWLAKYVSNILFDGKNSFKVYSALKQQKEQLRYSITQLQLDNARLQKEYFELKNLEPEE
jgi:hypothetical protein